MTRREFLGVAALSAANFACNKQIDKPLPTPTSEAISLFPGHPVDISCGTISNFTGVATTVNRPAFDNMLTGLDIKIPTGIEIAIVLGPFFSDRLGAWEQENLQATQSIQRTIVQSRRQKPQPLHREFLTVPTYKFVTNVRNEKNPSAFDTIVLGDIITTHIFTRLQELTTAKTDVNQVLDVLEKNQRPIVIRGVSPETVERVMGQLTPKR